MKKKNDLTQILRKIGFRVVFQCGAGSLILVQKRPDIFHREVWDPEPGPLFRPQPDLEVGASSLPLKDTLGDDDFINLVGAADDGKQPVASG